MRLNTPTKISVFTHEGARAAPHVTPLQQLRRSVLSCLLFEKEFYEDGQEIASRIRDLCGKVTMEEAAALAVEARSKFNLRHAPLYLAASMAKPDGGTSLIADTICNVIQRADELAEFLAIYENVWDVKPNELKKRMGAQTKKGLARAFQKFNAHALAKYNRDGRIKLRDVLFLCHAKPKDEAQATVWKQLVNGTLPTPDTWETNLSAGADKRETFERLIREGNLGYLALLRNLRNMADAGCDMSLVRDAVLARKNGAERVLPFRFIAAARACPQMEPALDQAMQAGLADLPRLDGRTVVLVDISGSMDQKLSARSDLRRVDAAAGLAAIIQADFLRVFSFSNAMVEVPPRKGMAGIDAIISSQPHGGTQLFSAVAAINGNVPHDRLIVITDEQAAVGMWGSVGSLPTPACPHAYMLNVASAKHGVGYGNGWTHIDGFSEQVIRYIAECEQLTAR